MVWKKQKCFSPSTRETQYCVEPLWPRGSVLGLRPPEFEFSNHFDTCNWRAVSSQSSHHLQKVLLAHFSLYKSSLKPDSFHFVLVSFLRCIRISMLWVYGLYKYVILSDFIRHNLTSIDVRFWRIKSIPALRQLLTAIFPGIISYYDNNNNVIECWFIIESITLCSNHRIMFYIAPHCIALRCIALHCIVLHWIELYCIVLHCIALLCSPCISWRSIHCTWYHYHFLLHCIAVHLNFTALNRITLYYIVIHCIAMYFITFYCTAFHFIVLHCMTFHHIVLHGILRQCIALHCIALHCIALHCIALHCIALHCITLHCIALHCITLYCIVLHCIALYCIRLHCIALHCIALHCIAWYFIALYLIVWHNVGLMLSQLRSGQSTQPANT